MPTISHVSKGENEVLPRYFMIVPTRHKLNLKITFIYGYAIISRILTPNCPSLIATQGACSDFLQVWLPDAKVRCRMQRKMKIKMEMEPLEVAYTRRAFR